MPLTITVPGEYTPPEAGVSICGGKISGTGVRVKVGDAVGISDGDGVIVGGWLGVGVGVEVSGTGLDVAVKVGVADGTGEGAIVAVVVGVSDGTGEGVQVAVRLAVGVSLDSTMTGAGDRVRVGGTGVGGIGVKSRSEGETLA